MSRRITFFLTLLLVTVLLAACGGDGGDTNGGATNGETTNGEAGAPSGETAGDPAAGEELYQMATIADTGAPGCTTCHSVEPTDDPLQPSPVGPSHYGLANRAGDYVEGMSAEEYIRESIVAPDEHIVEGYQPGVMYQNYEEDLTSEQIDNLVAYLLTLEGE
jgi:mono/diheme cytochrome c family protein